jgi:hypothetical protein
MGLKFERARLIYFIEYLFVKGWCQVLFSFNDDITNVVK